MRKYEEKKQLILSKAAFDVTFDVLLMMRLHRYYLNWTELDDDITEFNDELPLTENWVFTIVLLHYWHYFPI